MLCGGYSEEKKPDDVSLEIYNKIIDTIQYETIKFVSYKIQIVNGTNYLLKVLLADNTFLFIKVYKDLNSNIEVIEQDIRIDF